MPDDHHAIPTPRMLRIRREPVVAGVCRLAVTGELDVDSATRLRSEVTAVLGQRPAASVIEVDLAGVTFVDSLGIGTLVVAHRICAEMNVRLVVREPSPLVARALEVTGFRDHLSGAGP